MRKRTMKVWMAAGGLVLGTLCACGPSKELRQVRSEAKSLREEASALRAETRVLRAENSTLKSKVRTLEDDLEELTRERDELKLAAQKPAPAPSKKAGRK
ncbi:hypothetical protein [Stigmatella aurantiaca]|nr:hypothetical protein [Stigmatella aurantiaca]